MPNRMIRDSCKTSPSLAALSDLAERTFWRLVTVTDDFGRYHGDHHALLAACFPIGAPGLTYPRFHAALIELVGQDLFRFYNVDGRPYIHAPSWSKHQRLRASAAKFPQPPALAAPIGGRTAAKSRFPEPVDSKGRGDLQGSAAGVGVGVGVGTGVGGGIEPPLSPPRGHRVRAKAGPDSCGDCKVIIDHLNKATGRRYEASGKSGGFVHARHTRHGIAPCLRVIDRKVGAWLRHPKWTKFLRPETLFNPTKFDGYVNEQDAEPTGLLQPIDKEDP